MRLFLARAALAAACLSLPAWSVPAGAQEPDAPGVIEPAPVPPGEDGSPMIVPAPDEEVAPAPEAFGSGDVPADEAAELPPAESEATKAERLDALFAELRRQGAQEDAALIAGRIEREWVRSGSATVDLLMGRAASAMGRNGNAAALDLLDQVLVLQPDFAEGWNRRATLHFAMDSYGKSIADIEQTLAREPRHFGALMGLALILERTDRKAEALEAYLRALDIYPTLRSAQDAVERLSEELTGPAI